MTPEEIKALIEKQVSLAMGEGLKAGFGEFEKFFSEQMEGQIGEMTAKITALEEVATQPPSKPKPEDIEATQPKVPRGL